MTLLTLLQAVVPFPHLPGIRQACGVYVCVCVRVCARYLRRRQCTHKFSPSWNDRTMSTTIAPCPSIAAAAAAAVFFCNLVCLPQPPSPSPLHPSVEPGGARVASASNSSSSPGTNRWQYLLNSTSLRRCGSTAPCSTLAFSAGQLACRASSRVGFR